MAVKRGEPPEMTKEELDMEIESWLLHTLGVDVDFEVGDAIEMLEFIGAIERIPMGGVGKATTLLRAKPYNDAIQSLNVVWDGYF